MKNSLILLFILFLSQKTYGQIKQINIGKSHTIHSKILHEKREFWVHLPRNYDKHSSRKYPVLFLLDGQSHFYSLTGMIDQLSEDGNTKLPEMIIVGIFSTIDRTRDLTPTHSEGEYPYIDSAACIASGGNQNFISFIEKELIPYINSNYHSSSYRLIVGHSFGGLTALNILLTRTDLFTDYIAIDPSVWWDHKYILKESEKKISKINFKGKSLFIGIANTTINQVDRQEILNDTSYSNNHIRAIFHLEDLFSRTSTDIQFNSKFYPNDSHSSVPLITMYDALRITFRNFEIKAPLYDTTVIDSLFINKIQTHSNFLNFTYGDGTIMPFEFINECGYLALDTKKKKEALYLFQLNLKNYPNMWESFYALGDYYTEQTEMDKSLQYYKKAYKKLHYFAIKARIEEVEELLRKNNN